MPQQLVENRGVLLLFPSSDSAKSLRLPLQPPEMADEFVPASSSDVSWPEFIKTRLRQNITSASVNERTEFLQHALLIKIKRKGVIKGHCFRANSLEEGEQWSWAYSYLFGARSKNHRSSSRGPSRASPLFLPHLSAIPRPSLSPISYRRAQGAE